jgi:hypothetical protein
MGYTYLGDVTPLKGLRRIKKYKNRVRVLVALAFGVATFV